MDSFDEDGNISKEGTFIPIDVSFGTLTDDDDEEKNKIQKREYEIKDEDFEQNYKNIVKALFHFKEKSGDGKDQDFMGTVLSGFIKKIEDYIVNNIGNYDYDELVDVAVDGAWDILEDSEDEIAKRAADFVEEKISGLAKVDTPLDWVDDALNGAIEGLGAAGSWLAENGVDGLLSQLENNLLDENGIKASLKDFLKDDENKEAFINLIYSSITGDKTGYEGAADILKQNLSTIFVDHPLTGLGNIEGPIVEEFALSILIDKFDDITSEFAPKDKSPKKINSDSEIKTDNNGKRYIEQNDNKRYFNDK